jgi:hypothetical protein
MALDGLSTELRLWLAAGLAVVPMGLVWSVSSGLHTPGPILYGDCGYVEDGYACTPDQYLPGIYLPGSVTLVSQSPIRVFLVFAIGGLVGLALRPRTETTLRVARAVTLALAATAVLAAAHHATLTVVCMVLALTLLARPVWRPVPSGGVLASGQSSR